MKIGDVYICQRVASLIHKTIRMLPVADCRCFDTPVLLQTASRVVVSKQPRERSQRLFSMNSRGRKRKTETKRAKFVDFNNTNEVKATYFAGSVANGETLFLCCTRAIDAEFNVLFNDSFLQPIVFCCGGLAKNKTLLVMNVIATVCISLKSLKPSSGGFEIVAKLWELWCQTARCKLAEHFVLLLMQRISKFLNHETSNKPFPQISLVLQPTNIRGASGWLFWLQVAVYFAV